MRAFMAIGFRVRGVSTTGGNRNHAGATFCRIAAGAAKAGRASFPGADPAR